MVLELHAHIALAMSSQAKWSKKWGSSIMQLITLRFLHFVNLLPRGLATKNLWRSLLKRLSFSPPHFLGCVSNIVLHRLSPRASCLLLHCPLAIPVHSPYFASPLRRQDWTIPQAPSLQWVLSDILSWCCLDTSKIQSQTLRSIDVFLDNATRLWVTRSVECLVLLLVVLTKNARIGKSVLWDSRLFLLARQCPGPTWGHVPMRETSWNRQRFARWWHKPENDSEWLRTNCSKNGEQQEHGHEEE